MIAATTPKIIYTGDGVTTAFSFSMPLPVGSVGAEIAVYVFDSNNPQDQFLLTGNYSIVVGPIDASGKPQGGTLTYPTVGGVSPLGPGVNALPANWQIVIARVLPLAQLLSVLTQGVFDGPSFTSAFDNLCMMIQQLQEQVNRATLVPINTPGPANAIVAPTIAPFGVVQINGTWAQLVAYAQLNPTAQFYGFVSSGDMVGSQFFYSGNVAYGNQGFIAIGGG